MNEIVSKSVMASRRAPLPPLGARLKTLRLMRDLNLSGAARFSGIHRRRISRIERGEQNPLSLPIELFRGYAACLGLSETELIEECRRAGDATVDNGAAQR